MKADLRTMSSANLHQRCAEPLYALHNMYEQLQLPSRSRKQRTVLLTLGIAAVSLVFILIMAYQLNISPVAEEAYHPMQGRFLHNKNLKHKAINFNKLRFKAEGSTMKSAPSQHSILSNGSMVPPSADNKSCNCSKSQYYPFSSFQDRIGDSFSIIILTYNRTDLLLRLLNHYSAMPHLERIIVVWNSQDMAPPVEAWSQLGPHPVPVEFKVQRENRLRNRLQVFPEVKSSG